MLERTRRLFAGVRLDDGVRAQCAEVADRLRSAGFAARYEAPEKLHVTLAFLGYVTAERYEAIVSALRTAACRAPFSVVLDKVGAFPHERRPRVAYIGARDQGALFRALAHDMRAGYAALGFAFKEDPVAHVTIARVKAPGQPLPTIEFPAIGMRAEALTLFESLPDRLQNTSRYEALATAPLGEASQAHEN